MRVLDGSKSSIISIHALLAESDRALRQLQFALRRNFYPRSPCGERRIVDIINNIVDDFYPRSPCGERLHYDNYNLHCVEISIHALLAESDSANCNCRNARPISIHALLAESDSRTKTVTAEVSDFYPRSPCGERRITTITICTASKFLSTLSLRRATALRQLQFALRRNFYPRSPCGERRFQSVC